MADAPESWGAMSTEALTDLLQATVKQYATQLEEVAVDEAAYHRKFWSTWVELPDGMTVAAMNRECELACKELQGEVILHTSLREGIAAKQAALIAALGARGR